MSLMAAINQSDTFCFKMAASMQACCLHCCVEENSNFCPISKTNYFKICEKIKEWITLDGTERDVSLQLSLVSGNCPNCDFLFAGDEHCVSGCIVCSEQLQSFVYHRKCYGRFIDKTKVERARKRLTKGKPKVNPTNEADNCTSETDNPCSPTLPLLRSQISSPSVYGESRSASGKQSTTEISTDEYRKRLHLFPLECCFCRSDTKYMIESSSRKRKKEDLMIH